MQLDYEFYVQTDEWFDDKYGFDEDGEYYPYEYEVSDERVFDALVKLYEIENLTDDEKVLYVYKKLVPAEELDAMEFYSDEDILGYAKTMKEHLLKSYSKVTAGQLLNYLLSDYINEYIDEDTKEYLKDYFEYEAEKEFHENE